jgi:hypothetical protein|eukprot:COSAG02_NODE_2833_length_7927_cov_16.291007_6_plen_93_part_00
MGLRYARRYSSLRATRSTYFLFIVRCRLRSQRIVGTGTTTRHSLACRRGTHLVLFRLNHPSVVSQLIGFLLKLIDLSPLLVKQSHVHPYLVV